MQIKIQNNSLSKISFAGRNYTGKHSAQGGFNRYLSDSQNDFFLRSEPNSEKKKPAVVFSEAAARVGMMLNTRKANATSQLIDGMLPVYNAVIDFRNNIGEINYQQNNSIEDFRIFAKEHYKYKDYLANVNLYYKEDTQKYSDGDLFLGENARVYYDQDRIYLPFDSKPHKVNVPSKLAFNYTENNHGNIEFAREVYDVANDVMFGELQNYPDGGMTATQVNIFSPKDCGLRFAKFASILGTPATVNNARITPDGDFTADSIVLYEVDKDDNIVSSTTLMNPSVVYGGEVGEYSDKYFTLCASSSFTCDYSTGQNSANTYLLSPKVTATRKQVSTEALSALESCNGITRYFSDYCNIGDYIYYSDKKYIDLSQIK